MNAYPNLVALPQTAAEEQSKPTHGGLPDEMYLWGYLEKVLGPETTRGCMGATELQSGRQRLLALITAGSMDPADAPRVIGRLEVNLRSELIGLAMAERQNEHPYEAKVMTWGDYLRRHYPLYHIALHCAAIVGGIAELDRRIGIGLSGRNLMEAMVGRELTERAEELHYQGFPGSLHLLTTPYCGHTEF